MTYQVAANTGSSTRSGILTIAGQSFTVTQSSSGTTPPPSPSCTYVLTDVGNPFEGVVDKLPTVDSDGETKSIKVSTSSTCAWQTDCAADWVEITSGSAVTGSGVMTYEVEKNPLKIERKASLTVAGMTITITQEGNPQGSGLNSKLLYFPLVAVNGGWSTKVMVCNPNAQSLVGTLVPMTADGEVACPGIPVTLAPNGVTKIDLGTVLDDNCQAEYIAFEGEDLDLIPTGYAEYDFSGMGRVTVRMVDPEDSGALLLPTGGIWTGVAILNTGDDSTAVTLTAYNADGQQVALKTLSLEAGQKIATLIEMLFSGQDLSSARSIKYASDGQPLSVILFHGNPEGPMLQAICGQ